jgi:REP element-mobilizing transposase RayT
MKLKLSIERRASSPVGTPAGYSWLMQYEYRRRLPHYQPDHKIFFFTFCTHKRWRMPERARQIVLDACLRGNGVLFDLLAVVVMPNHVHLALVPKALTDGTVFVSKILQTIKGASAHRINRELGPHGSVCQQESFDRALRREGDVGQKIDYMLENPLRAGLVRNPLDYPWIWRKVDGPERISFAGKLA